MVGIAIMDESPSIEFLLKGNGMRTSGGVGFFTMISFLFRIEKSEKVQHGHRRIELHKVENYGTQAFIH